MRGAACCGGGRGCPKRHMGRTCRSVTIAGSRKDSTMLAWAIAMIKPLMRTGSGSCYC